MCPAPSPSPPERNFNINSNVNSCSRVVPAAVLMPPARCVAARLAASPYWTYILQLYMTPPGVEPVTAGETRLPWLGEGPAWPCVDPARSWLIAH